MYMHMTEEQFQKFDRAAEAFADMNWLPEWWNEMKVYFYKRYYLGYVKECKKLPARCTVVYLKGDTYGKYGNYRHDCIYSVNTRVVELRKVKITEKFIVFDDGYVLPFSKIKFFVW